MFDECFKRLTLIFWFYLRLMFWIDSIFHVLQPVQRDTEVTVEDVQVFLMKQQSYLSKAPSPGAGGVCRNILFVIQLKLKKKLDLLNSGNLETN